MSHDQITHGRAAGSPLAFASVVTRAADESAEALASKLKEMYPATKIERVQRSELRVSSKS
jgi:hypothetical protein